jgi:predicted RNase H-like nuclease
MHSELENLMEAGSATCVGVDGAKAKWIAVWRGDSKLEFCIYDSAADLVASHRQAPVIAVDIPIGLSGHGPRSPDVLARAFVGGKRACSIFSAPVRGILDAMSQPEASRRHREIDTRGFGAQAFAILAKIREWDDLLSRDSIARTQVREVHPEVSFAALNSGRGLPSGKKKSAGSTERRQLLAEVFRAELVDQLIDEVPRSQAALDDVLDALVALWSAERIAAGKASTLPHPVAVDSQGLVMAIHY